MTDPNEADRRQVEAVFQQMLDKVSEWIAMEPENQLGILQMLAEAHTLAEKDPKRTHIADTLDRTGQLLMVLHQIRQSLGPTAIMGAMAIAKHVGATNRAGVH